MKASDYYWDHPDLIQYRSRMKAGEYLFHRGDDGGSMYIILQGTAELLGERDGQELKVGLVQPGEFLGEKALVREGTHRRVFGVRAKTDITYLMLEISDIEALRVQNPELVIDMLKHMFLLAARRLDRFTHLSRVLRSSKNIERFIQLVRHLCYFTGRNTNGGFDVSISVDLIRYYIDMSVFEIEECLKELHEN